MPISRRIAVLLLPLLFQSGLARAEEAGVTVGKANRIQNLVQASLGERKLAPADPVFGSEFISAGQRSHGELLLNDNSKILVGENSQISLDEFVLGQGGFEQATLNVAKGAFRFISGNSRKGAFTIRTPLSSIGVRGTIFDVYVGPDGVTEVVLLQGQVRVCTLGNACVIADRACDIVRVSSQTEVSEQPFLRSARRSAAQERAQFSLLANQGRFDRAWRAPTVLCNSRAALEIQDGRQQPGGDGGNAPGQGNEGKGEGESQGRG